LIRFVLTAAHCVPNPEGLDVEVILGNLYGREFFWFQKIICILGAHDIRTISESKTLRLRAVTVSVHDQYAADFRQGFVVYDFALLELNETVNFLSLPPHKTHPHAGARIYRNRG
jgi:hypothetical protein